MFRLVLSLELRSQGINQKYISEKFFKILYPAASGGGVFDPLIYL